MSVREVEYVVEEPTRVVGFVAVGSLLHSSKNIFTMFGETKEAAEEALIEAQQRCGYYSIDPRTIRVFELT